MADSLYELLTPYLELDGIEPSSSVATTNTYLDRLTTLSLDDLKLKEPESLNASAQSASRSLQALSKRSHRSIVAVTDQLSNLAPLLSTLDEQSTTLKSCLPVLDTAASDFARKYDRNTENAVLDRRKSAMQLNDNVDRVGNILELPSLLSSTIDTTFNVASGAATTLGYGSALDVHAHVKRLKALYPDSEIVKNVAQQSDAEIESLVTLLVTSLQSPSLKLAGAMRTIGWLRRIAPELALNTGRVLPDEAHGLNAARLGHYTEEGPLGALFLVCRLAGLRRTLEALNPLKELADHDISRPPPRTDNKTTSDRSSRGTQTERYLKRYIEAFREHSFAIISMYKSVFPAALPMPTSAIAKNDVDLVAPLEAAQRSNGMGTESVLVEETGENSPSALASFAPYLVDMLFDTLREYLPSVTDRSSRDSLLTQVLYCAGSLGRLGADFGFMLSILGDELEDAKQKARRGGEPESGPEWVQVMKKHKVQASRLDLLASGVNSGGARKVGTPMEVRSPPTTPTFSRAR